MEGQASQLIDVSRESETVETDSTAPHHSTVGCGARVSATPDGAGR